MWVWPHGRADAVVVRLYSAIEVSRADLGLADLSGTRQLLVDRQRLTVASLRVRFIRSTCPLVHGWLGLVRRCSMPFARQISWKGWRGWRAIWTCAVLVERHLLIRRLFFRTEPGL